uniref:Uncharacterized protein n=1 Tax=Oryza sativa subsp. japonica TaxID=39947 RepID=Q6Z3R4_ORYSJ|nr:hypothetical protein [Oryza sativa Japonica Group]
MKDLLEEYSQQLARLDVQHQQRLSAYTAYRRRRLRVPPHGTLPILPRRMPHTAMVAPCRMQCRAVSCLAIRLSPWSPRGSGIK